METTTKITKANYYDAIIEAMTTGETPIAPEDIVAFCEREKEQLAHKAEKAKERAATKKIEGDALRDAVQAALTTELSTIADITARVEGEEVTVGKVQYRLNSLVAAGLATKGEVSIPATETTKARKVVGFAIAE